MKAYKLSCLGIDYHGECVVFAENSGQARLRDSRDCDCEFVDVTIRRAPNFDDLYPGPITIRQYIERGWYFPCGNCDRHLYSDDSPIILDDWAFCGRACVVAARNRHNPQGAHESIVKLCQLLDEWLNGGMDDENTKGTQQDEIPAEKTGASP